MIHLRWREIVLKPGKVYNYFIHDCLNFFRNKFSLVLLMRGNSKNDFLLVQKSKFAGTFTFLWFGDNNLVSIHYKYIVHDCTRHRIYFLSIPVRAWVHHVLLFRSNSISGVNVRLAEQIYVYKVKSWLGIV